MRLNPITNVRDTTLQPIFSPTRKVLFQIATGGIQPFGEYLLPPTGNSPLIVIGQPTPVGQPPVQMHHLTDRSCTMIRDYQQRRVTA